MSRVIKFRAWDGLRMVRIPFYVNCEGNLYKDNDPHGLDMSGKRSISPMPNCVVMQSTGLKDKNGVEIYEGDVVKKGDQSFSNGPDTDDTFYRGGTAHVVAVPFGFYMSEIDCGEWCFNGPEGREWDNAEIEVIGNIYQNPELLNPTQP